MKNNNWLRAFGLIIPYFISIVLFQAIGMLISGIGLDDIEGALSTQQHCIISLFGCIGTLVIVWVFMKYVDEEPFLSMGFQLKNRIKDIIIGLFLGLFIMWFGYLVLLTLDEITYVKTNYSTEEMVYTFFIFLFVAITEEVLCRGYVLKNFLSSMNPFAALLFSSLLFSLLHSFNPNMNWFSFISLFIAGIFLGATYIYTKNLWFPIAIHFSWNFFQTLFGFNVSGQDIYSLIEFKITENNLLNGGDFGFEGSVFSIGIEIVLIIAIIAYYTRKKSTKYITNL